MCTASLRGSRTALLSPGSTPHTRRHVESRPRFAAHGHSTRVAKTLPSGRATGCTRVRCSLAGIAGCAVVAFVMEWHSPIAKGRDTLPRADERPCGCGSASRHAPGGRSATRRHAGWRHARCPRGRDVRTSGPLVPHRGTVPTRFASLAAKARRAMVGVARTHSSRCCRALWAATGLVQDDCLQVQQSQNRCHQLRRDEAVGDGERHHPYVKCTYVHFFGQAPEAASRLLPALPLYIHAPPSQCRTPPVVRIMNDPVAHASRRAGGARLQACEPAWEIHGHSISAARFWLWGLPHGLVVPRHGGHIRTPRGVRHDGAVLDHVVEQCHEVMTQRASRLLPALSLYVHAPPFPVPHASSRANHE